MRIPAVLSALTRPLLGLAALCLFAAALAACGGGGARNFADGPEQQLGGASGPSVKVAVLLPLSAPGNTANVAKAMKQAGELALFDFNNPNVTLLSKDTMGTPEGARAAAEAAVAEGAELIIGPLFAKEVTAAAPAVRAAGVPMIAFSSDRTVAGNGVYLLSFLAGRDVPRIVGYTVAQGRRNFAALIPNTPYGQLVERAFRDSVSQRGGNLVALEKFPLDANGMLEPAKRVAAYARGEGRQIDALFIPAGAEILPQVAALIPYFEIDTGQVKVIGTQEWDFPNVAREKSLQGGWFPAPDPAGWQNFTQNYVKTYESTPPRLASLSYDAVSLAVSLAKSSRGQRFAPAQLTRSSGFAGVDGLFRLLPDGTSERGLAVLEVQKFGTRVIDTAPTSFGSAQF
ncbi:MAG: penicillin-binding protein activator [Hyphomicrobiales bacterium]